MENDYNIDFWNEKKIKERKRMIMVVITFQAQLKTALK